MKCSVNLVSLNLHLFILAKKLGNNFLHFLPSEFRTFPQLFLVFGSGGSVCYKAMTQTFNSALASDLKSLPLKFRSVWSIYYIGKYTVQYIDSTWKSTSSPF